MSEHECRRPRRSATGEAARQTPDPGPPMDSRMEGAEPETLDQLRPGQAARVTALAGEEAFRARLRDLGLREGELVITVKQAPLADPVEYCVNGTHLSLRRSEARNVSITGAVWVGSRRHRGGRASCEAPEAPRGDRPACGGRGRFIRRFGRGCRGLAK